MTGFEGGIRCFALFSLGNVFDHIVYLTNEFQEFACFSYDDKHEFRLDDSSLQWYYPPRLGADLSKGFDKFDKHDESIDEHLDSLLKTIAAHEKEEGKKIDANIVTWRGMMTKVGSPLFQYRRCGDVSLIVFYR